MKSVRLQVISVIVVDYQSQFRARGDAVACALLIARSDHMVFQDRKSFVVDWEDVGVDGEALGVPGAPAAFKSDLQVIVLLNCRRRGGRVCVSASRLAAM